MSTRKTIISTEIIDILEDITDIGEVTRTPKNWTEVSEYPACVVLGGDEEYTHNANEYYDSSMEVRIFGYVHDEDNPDDAIDDHLEDVIQALENLNRAWFLESVETDGMSNKPYGIFLLTISVDYEFSLSSP